VPPNTLESIQNRMIKVNRYLQREFKSKEELDKAVKESLRNDKNGNIGLDSLKNFVLSHLKDHMINKKLSKRDIEGFLSSFVYNTYGETHSDAVANTVFATENVVANNLNHRVRGNPPPVDTMGDLDLYDVKEDEIHSQRVQNVMKEIEEKVFDGPTKMH